MSEPKCEELKWTLEVLTGSKVKSFSLSHAQRVDEQASFAVRGRLPKGKPVLYVLNLEGQTGNVRVALRAQVRKLSSTAKGEVRLPQAGAFLVSQAPSEIHVLAANRVLTPDELMVFFLDIVTEPPPDPTTRESTASSDASEA